MEAKYYIISSYGGGLATGKTTDNYHCFCEIYDTDGKAIKEHPLSEVFYGKWRRCNTLMKRWQKAVDKANLQRLKQDEISIKS